MLHQISQYADIDERMLMNIYREGNGENANYFYPYENRECAVQKAEQDFLRYLQNDFFASSGRIYWVLEENAEWVSALRTHQLKPSMYYLEALETHPAHRGKGCASRLLGEVLGALQKQGAFRLCDCVSKSNTASLRTHEKCGFKIVSKQGYDYVSGESDESVYGLEYVYGEP